MTFIPRARKLFLKAEKLAADIKAPNELARIAFETLAESDIDRHFSSETFSEILLHKKYPPHYYQMRNFSDAPFTLIRGEKMFLDLYFWRRSDTDIHCHHFTGAFKMLQGRQHQIVYQFEKEKKLFPFLEQGRLKTIEKRDFQRGQTQMIKLGGDFIHHTLHDDTQVTVNLCLRTPTFPGRNLYSYLHHGYKQLNMNYSDDRTRKLSLIKAFPEHEQTKMIASFLGQQDLFTLVSLYKGDSFTAPFLQSDFKPLIELTLKKRFPSSFKKLENYIGMMPKHLNLNKKLRFFMESC